MCIRVNPDVDAGEHRIVKTGTAKCKFGIAIESMPEVAKIVQDHGLHIIGLCVSGVHCGALTFLLIDNLHRTGLHQHTGSGISDPAKLTKAVSRMFEAASVLYKAGAASEMWLSTIVGQLCVTTPTNMHAGQLEHLRFIDIGGGFKVPYRPDDKPIPLGLLVSRATGLVRSPPGLLGESMIVDVTAYLTRHQALHSW